MKTLVDDVEKTSSNNAENLILIKPYFYGKNNELLKLIKYLEKIKNVNRIIFTIFVE